ncbi:TolC family protein [Beggiatoa alba]|nr:TolC family protein [Beggiatoa alba]
MNKILVLLLLSGGLVISPPSLAQPTLSWTLDASIQRALKVSPEMKTADAKIGKQQGKLEQSSAWPNPSISIQVDDTLGLEDMAGGYAVTQLSISQPLAIGRLALQRQQAETGLASVQAQRRHQQLLLEYRVAQRFHILQLAQAKLQLAKKRLLQARRYQKSGHKRRSSDPLIRYLTPLETMRLDIVLQAAKQTQEVAEGEFSEAAASFKALLGIPIDDPLRIVPLTPTPTAQGYPILENSLQNHPALEADKKTIASSRMGISVAQSQRVADPILTLFRGEGFYASRRQESMGIMLSVQVPLWDRNNGRITQARYAVYQAQAELDLKQRELQTNLHKSYQHLGHLIKQAEHYRSKLLKPVQRMFALTRKGFAAGELNILSLIDANNTYFDAQQRYLELLQEGWLELAEVRKSAGVFVTVGDPMITIGIYFGEVK